MDEETLSVENVKHKDEIMSVTTVEVHVPTTSLRWHNGVLQQLCIVESEGGSKHKWIEVPVVTEKPTAPIKPVAKKSK